MILLIDETSASSTAVITVGKLYQDDPSPNIEPTADNITTNRPTATVLEA